MGPGGDDKHEVAHDQGFAFDAVFLDAQSKSPSHPEVADITRMDLVERAVTPAVIGTAGESPLSRVLLEEEKLRVSQGTTS
ncbi:hypothetical protein Thermus77923_13580 [Thermus oshimai]